MTRDAEGNNRRTIAVRVTTDRIETAADLGSGVRVDDVSAIFLRRRYVTTVLPLEGNFRDAARYDVVVMGVADIILRVQIASGARMSSSCEHPVKVTRDVTTACGLPCRRSCRPALLVIAAATTYT
jgi:hypothetical protein